MNAGDVVRETAAQREASTAPRPMTIAEAFAEARWLRRMPDGILSPGAAKRTIETLFAAIDAHPCLMRALERGQEIFVLVEQDKAASYAIDTWGVEARAHGCPKEKVEEAFQTAQRWRHSPRIATKWPD